MVTDVTIGCKAVDVTMDAILRFQGCLLFSVFLFYRDYFCGYPFVPRLLLLQSLPTVLPRLPVLRWLPMLATLPLLVYVPWLARLPVPAGL
jgi:hypothetical protein